MDRETILYGFGSLLLVYLWTAGLVFLWRHPWMTSTERFFYTGQMLTFSTVTKEEVDAWEQGER